MEKKEGKKVGENKNREERVIEKKDVENRKSRRKKAKKMETIKSRKKE